MFKLFGIRLLFQTRCDCTTLRYPSRTGPIKDKGIVLCSQVGREGRLGEHSHCLTFSSASFLRNTVVWWAKWLEGNFKKMFQVVVTWKKNDNLLLHIPLSHLPREYFSTSGLYFKWIWVVTLEPQLTHLKAPICVGHLTLLTYFLLFLSVTQISPTWKRGPSMCPRSTDNRGVSHYL